MIMPDDDYGMDHVAHSTDDEDNVQNLHLMVMNYARYNGMRVVELLGALEIVKYLITYSTYGDEMS